MIVLFSFVVQSILPVQPEQKEQPDPPPVRSDTNTRHHKLHTKHQTPDLFLMHILSDTSGPRCTALFDYEGEEEDELTFSQGDVIALLEVIGQEWGRGQIHGRIGIFPLNFVEVVEPLPQPVSSPGETTKTTSADTTVIESTGGLKNPVYFTLFIVYFLTYLSFYFIVKYTQLW